MKLSKSFCLLLTITASTAFALDPGQIPVIGRYLKYTYTYVNGSCVKVVSNKMSQIITTPQVPLTSVTPTMTESTVNVTLQNDSIDARNIIGKSYYIVSPDGIMHKTGVLNNIPESIDLSDLREGQYFLLIGGDEYLEEFKIIKK